MLRSSLLFGSMRIAFSCASESISCCRIAAIALLIVASRPNTLYLTIEKGRLQWYPERWGSYRCQLHQGQLSLVSLSHSQWAHQRKNARSNIDRRWYCSSIASAPFRTRWRMGESRRYDAECSSGCMFERCNACTHNQHEPSLPVLELFHRRESLNRSNQPRMSAAPTP